MTKKIRVKYSMLVLVFLIFAIILAFVLVGNTVSTIAFEQACATNLEVMKQTKPSITNLTEDTRFVSENVLGNEALVEMMRRSANYYEQIEADQYRLGITFSSLFRSRNYLDSISVFNDDAILLQFGTLVSQEDMSRIDEISALRGQTLWTAAEYYPHRIYGTKGEAVVSLYRALNDLYAMKQLGYQRISVKESAIYERYAAMTGEGIHMFIVNGAGDVVSADDKSLLGKNLSGEAYYEKLRDNVEGYFLDQGQVYAYYSIGNPEWYVVRVVSEADLMGIAQAITNTLTLCMLLCIAFVIVFFVLQRKAILTENIYKDALLNREMELKYLQGQINPHFLYNTLDTIRWMAVKNEQGKIAEQVKALSDIFRHTLNQGMAFTTVSKEVEHVNKYMLIQQNRFGGRVNYEVDADENCLDLSVPNLILQPIVENAVVHGLEGITAEGWIHVRIFRDEKTLYYVVSDNGVGFNLTEIEQKMADENQQHEVFALKNIDERLKLLYGDSFGLELQSTVGRGSRITIKLKPNR